jgi:hypothetical protein
MAETRMAFDEATRPSLVARTVDYLFGRNTLIGVAELMLLLIAGYATWHGMRDFIVGVSTTPTKPGGSFSLSNDLLVVMVVVTLTFLMWLMLRETFASKRLLRYRLVTFPLYAFLALWSIGFGYGFWWSLISGEEATRTGLSGLQEDARDAAAIVSARLSRQRRDLVRRTNGARGDVRRQLRRLFRCRARPALQRPPERPRQRDGSPRRYDEKLAGAGASGHRAA